MTGTFDIGQRFISLSIIFILEIIGSKFQKKERYFPTVITNQEGQTG